MTVRLELPASLEYRELVTRSIEVTCKVAASRVRIERSKDFTNELVSAIGEAFNNVVLHAYRARAPGVVGITATFDSKQIVIEITDDGLSFNPSEIAAPDLGALPEYGLGLYIIQSFVDTVEYFRGPPNILRLTKLMRTSP